MSVQSRRCSLFPSLPLLLADAPAWLKKELDTILTLQGDLNAMEKAIHAAKITLSQSSTLSKLTKILRGLEEMHLTKSRSFTFHSTFKNPIQTSKELGWNLFEHSSWLAISKSTSKNKPLGVFSSGIDWIKQLVGEATLSVCFFISSAILCWFWYFSRH